MSNLLCIVGIGLSLSSLAGLCLALFAVPLIVRRIKGEEAMMIIEFGHEYTGYWQAVIWRLVAHIF